MVSNNAAFEITFLYHLWVMFHISDTCDVCQGLLNKSGCMTVQLLSDRCGCMTVQLLSDRCGCLFSYYQTGLDV